MLRNTHYLQGCTSDAVFCYKMRESGCNPTSVPEDLSSVPSLSGVFDLRILNNDNINYLEPYLKVLERDLCL